MRLAYRENPESLQRRCVIVGSTNDATCLPNDPSGNRRFVPLTVTEGDPAFIAAYMDANRDQIWAEALCHYDQGETAYLPHTLSNDAAVSAEGARHSDNLLEDALDEWLGARGPEPFTMKQAASGVQLLGVDSSPVHMKTSEQDRLRPGCLQRPAVPA